MSSIPQKRCTKCRVEKPLTDFHKNASCEDGLQHRCKQCRRDDTYTYSARSNEWRSAHLDSFRASSRNWKITHKAEDREIQRKWRQTPNGKRYALHHRTLRRANIKGDVTADQFKELFERQTHCAYCKRKFTTKQPPTVDHVIPLSKGGLHTISNLVLACKPCNSRKSNTVTNLI